MMKVVCMFAMLCVTPYPYFNAKQYFLVIRCRIQGPLVNKLDI